MNIVRLWTVVCIGFFGQGVAFSESFNIALYEDGHPPFYMAKTSFKKGIAVEILKEIFANTKDSVIYSFHPRDKIEERFARGTIQIIPAVDPHWKTGPQTDALFSVPFVTSEEVMLWRKDQKKSISTEKDLQGLAIGTVFGHIYGKFDKSLTQGTLKRVEALGEPQMMEDFLAGRSQMVFVSKIFADYWLHSQPKDKSLYAYGDSIAPLSFVLKIHSSRKEHLERINSVIEGLRKSGSLIKILASYGVKPTL